MRSAVFSRDVHRSVSFTKVRRGPSYPLASVSLHEQQFGPFEATLPIVGETRKDALMIAELVLRGHEPARDLNTARDRVAAAR